MNHTWINVNPIRLMDIGYKGSPLPPYVVQYRVSNMTSLFLGTQDNILKVQNTVLQKFTFVLTYPKKATFFVKAGGWESWEGIWSFCKLKMFDSQGSVIYSRICFSLLFSISSFYTQVPWIHIPPKVSQLPHIKVLLIKLKLKGIYFSKVTNFWILKFYLS